MGDYYGYARPEPRYVYPLPGIGRGTGQPPVFAPAQPGLLPRLRNSSHLKLTPELLKLMENAKGCVKYLKARRKQIMDTKRERELAEEVEDIDWCLAVIQDVNVIETLGEDTLRSAYNKVIDLGRAHPIDLEDTEVEVIEVIPTPNPSGGGLITTDFNFTPSPYGLLPYSSGAPIPNSAFERTQYLSRPGAPNTFQQPCPMYPPPVQQELAQFGQHANPGFNQGPGDNKFSAQLPLNGSVPATASYYPYHPGYQHQAAYVERSQALPRYFRGPNFMQQGHGGTDLYQHDYNNSHVSASRRTPLLPTSTNEPLTHQDNLPYDSHFDSYQHQQQHSPEHQERRNNSFGHGPPGHQQQQSRPLAPPTQDETDPVSPDYEYSATSSTSNSSVHDLAAITKAKAQRCFQGNRGRAPRQSFPNLGGSHRPRGHPPRYFVPSNVPRKQPFKLNQPAPRNEPPTGTNSITTCAVTLSSSNLIPVGPRPSPPKNPQKNLQETVERVKNKIASKPLPRTKQLEDLRKKFSQANAALVRPALAKRLLPSDSQEQQSTLSLEDRVESSIRSDESSEEQDHEPVRKVRKARKAATKPGSVNIPVIPKNTPVVKLKRQKIPVPIPIPKSKNVPEPEPRDNPNSRSGNANKRKFTDPDGSMEKPAPKKQKVNTSLSKEKPSCSAAPPIDKGPKVRADHAPKKQKISPSKAKPSPSAAPPKEPEVRTVSVSASSKKKKSVNKAKPSGKGKRTSSNRKRIVSHSSDSNEDIPAVHQDSEKHVVPLPPAPTTCAELNVDRWFGGLDAHQTNSYGEMILPRSRIRYKHKEGQQPPMPIPVFVDKPRVLGEADFHVNLGLFKVKIEADYIPPVAIKPEPEDGPFVHQEDDLAQEVPDESNFEDIEKEMEEMFAEDSKTVPKTESNNIVIDELDIPDISDEESDDDDAEEHFFPSIKIRSLQTILETTDCDDRDGELTPKSNADNVLKMEQNSVLGHDEETNSNSVVFLDQSEFPMSSVADSSEIRVESETSVTEDESMPFTIVSVRSIHVPEDVRPRQNQ